MSHFISPKSWIPWLLFSSRMYRLYKFKIERNKKNKTFSIGEITRKNATNHEIVELTWNIRMQPMNISHNQCYFVIMMCYCMFHWWWLYLRFQTENIVWMLDKLIFAIRLNQFHSLTGLQFAVFQMLPHDVHGKSLVNDAKKNRNDHAIITL